jgi:glycerate kinase
MLVPGVDVVAEAVGLASAIADADLVLTGEGRIDRQSLMGKVVGAVARMSRAAEVPCIALCGAAGSGADECLSVLDSYRTLDAPIDQTASRLVEEAESAARQML